MGDSASIPKLTTPEAVRELLKEKFRIPSIPRLYDVIQHLPIRVRTRVRDLLLDGGFEQQFWVMREAVRMLFRDYQMVDFTPTSTMDEQLLHFLYLTPEHFVHISKDTPMYIAYTPDATYGRQDRRVKTTVGRYLKKFYSDSLNDQQIRQLVDSFRYHYGTEDIHWAATPEEMVEVYTSGPGSCMSHTFVPANDVRWGSHCHPVEVYGYAQGIRMAYLKRDGKINSRCLVFENPDNPEDKRWIRIYGDEVLRMKLEANGYRHGSLVGAKLPKIQALRKSGRPLPDTYVMPYIDDVTSDDRFYQGVRLEGDVWIVCHRRETRHIAVQTNGLIGEHKNYYRANDARYVIPGEEEEQVQCWDCGENVSRSSLRHSTYHNADICRDCISAHYQNAIYNSDGDHTYIHRDDIVFAPYYDEWFLRDQNLLAENGLVELTHPFYDGYQWEFSSHTCITEGGHTIRTHDSATDTRGRIWHYTDVYVFTQFCWPKHEHIEDDERIFFYSTDGCLVHRSNSDETGLMPLRQWLLQIAERHPPAERFEALREAVWNELSPATQVLHAALLRLLEAPENCHLRTRCLADLVEAA